MKNPAREQTEKTKYKSENQNSLWNNSTGVTCQQLCHSHLGTVVPASLGNSRTSVTWEELCQSQLGAIAPVSLVSVSL